MWQLTRTGNWNIGKPMGTEYEVICNKCDCHFIVSDGGGFFFHLLHCDKCGKEKDISFEEIGEPHLRYLKGLSGPYCVASSDHDKFIRENYPGAPLTRNEYHRIIEDLAGECDCGGAFKFEAKPRCPECNSTSYKEDPEGGVVCYD